MGLTNRQKNNPYSKAIDDGINQAIPPICTDSNVPQVGMDLIDSNNVETKPIPDKPINIRPPGINIFACKTWGEFYALNVPARLCTSQEVDHTFELWAQSVNESAARERVEIDNLKTGVSQ
jgi:hypothetical protein